MTHRPCPTCLTAEFLRVVDANPPACLSFAPRLCVECERCGARGPAGGSEAGAWGLWDEAGNARATAIEAHAAAEEEERFWASLDAPDPDDEPHGPECHYETCLQNHPERDEANW